MLVNNISVNNLTGQIITNNSSVNHIFINNTNNISNDLIKITFRDLHSIDLLCMKDENTIHNITKILYNIYGNDKTI